MGWPQISSIIRHLPYFVVAAEEKHFQRAAKRLNIAQSALSRRMQEFERELGNVPLFVRAGRRISLTPSGEAVLREARRIMAQMDETKELALAVMNGEAGVVRVGYTVGSLGHRFLDVVLRTARTALPGFDFQTSLVSVEHYAQQLRDGEILAAVVHGDLIDDDLASFDIVTEAYQLAVSSEHPLAQKERVRFQDIVDEGFIWYAKILEPGMHARLFEAFRAHAAVPKISVESPTLDTALRWVGFHKAGITLVPIRQQPWMPPGITIKPIDDFQLVMSFRLVWRRDNETAIVPKMIEAVRQELQKVGLLENERPVS